MRLYREAGLVQLISKPLSTNNGCKERGSTFSVRMDLIAWLRLGLAKLQYANVSFSPRASITNFSLAFTSKQVLTSVVVFLLICSLIRAEDPVYFVDANLKAAVESELGIMDPTPTDMLTLTYLKTGDKGIISLEGLEYARNLEKLNVRWNKIVDISPLAGLTALRDLNVSQNDIVDITAISDLRELAVLDLHENEIRDISPVRNLTRLHYLDVHCNQIRDISALSNLRQLDTLDLYQNRIVDISSLSGLTELVNLNLYTNDISNISALSGLDKLDWLRLDNNAIEDISPLGSLQNLNTVYLGKNQIENLTPLQLLPHIYNLELQDNKIKDLSSLVLMTTLSSLDIRHNPLSNEAYCVQKNQILATNPGLLLRYSPNKNPPTEICASDGLYSKYVTITWEPLVCGESQRYFRVSRSATETGKKTPLSPWQSSSFFQDSTAVLDQLYYYWVQTANMSQGHDAGPYSLPDSGYRTDRPPLSLSSAAGGMEFIPAPVGVPDNHGNQQFSIQALPIDNTLFVFDRWSGTVVDAGGVPDIYAADTQVTIRSPGTLRAHFLALRGTIYVDDDVNHHAYADGTRDFPWPCIQKAIDVADAGARVLVQSGTYPETLHFHGRDIVVKGDPGPQGLANYPVIDAQNLGTTVSFTQGETSACLLDGFVITGGWGPLAGGVLCIDSGPTLSHCLIVGNRAYGNPIDVGAILCLDAPVCFEQCTIADNMAGEHGAAIRLINSNVHCRNSILYNPDTGIELSVDPNSNPTISYCCIQAGWPGMDNLSAPPAFAASGYWENATQPGVGANAWDPNAIWQHGDYHLKSSQGRWDPDDEAWQQDEITSPCIDIGDPLISPDNEPLPNGDIANLGAYGDSAQASLSENEEVDEPASPDVPVYFTDSNLKEAVEAELGFLDPTRTDMLALTRLVARDLGITSLDGLEHALNLEVLNVRWNALVDVAPLVKLTELRDLNISQNDIVDISAISGLRKLRVLDMHENEITDISPVRDLYNVHYLDIHCNQIRDIGAVTALTQLDTLDLYQNLISDISPLAGLTELVNLNLYTNNISTLSALTGLHKLDWLRLDNNAITDISPLSHLQNLLSLYLSGNQIDSIASLESLTSIQNLELQSNSISDISALLNVTSLVSLDIRNNPLSQEAYCVQLDQIASANPGVLLRYTSNTRPPTGVDASDGLHSYYVAISWEPLTCVEGPRYYRVSRSETKTSSKTPISPWLSAFSFHDTTASANQTYYYWVQTAVYPNGYGAGPHSVPDSGYRLD